MNVRELNVSRNRLSSLPESLGAMRRLARLDCRENEIRELPASVEGCDSLAELYLGHNSLATIPDEIGFVASLRTLDVSNNALKELRPSLANVPLSLLDASGNDIVAVAPELGRCVTLRKLMLEGNPLKSIRYNILAGPTRELLAHLRSKLSDERDDVNAAAAAFGKVFIGADDAVVIASATHADRVAFEGGRGTLLLRDRGVERVPIEAWDIVATRVACVDLGLNGLKGDACGGGSNSDALATAVGKCKRLETLLLDGNDLSSWPLPHDNAPPLPLLEMSLANNARVGGAVQTRGVFSRASNMTRLDLSGVVIAARFVDDGLLGPLANLVELRWARGDLTRVPEDVYWMRKLRALALPDNRIGELRAEVSELTQVRSIHWSPYNRVGVVNADP